MTLDTFKAHIEQQFPGFFESKLLIAISGGVDSVVLTHLCHQLGLDVSLVHCNFNLRGTESDGDADFVFQLAKDLSLDLFLESFQTEAYAAEHKLSIQLAARQLRYDWFDELAKQLHFDYVLTAHHADDNLETFLINLTRGTGLDGLTGIPEVNGLFVRPLLPFSRNRLVEYAEEHQLTWREDSSNASTKYLRNKLRHDVIPLLKEINPQLLQNFEKTIGFLKASKSIIEDHVEEVEDSVIKEISEYDVKYDISKIKALSNPQAYLYELLKAYNFTEWNDVEDLLDAQSGKQLFSETHRLIKDREFLLLSEIEDKQETLILVSECDDKIKTPLGNLYFSEAAEVSNQGPNVIFVDKKKLKYPLTIRHWKEGDYFHPLGMKGKKKLSKYFKDEKMSLLEKENALVLCSGDYIIWVIGKRPDGRFKVCDHTHHIIKIELK
ncbi:tRNA lysidine(34) synthetase TilS [Mangrovimonas sp. TPBH4]|uniref:tRNA lysidine(34) synthetase TilS n=1 Tax=Mangrovimonas sp. TPBH4 TaxID=1645914 RepID=UPI0006B419E0|nr:tRNA lysidine(34) synthetase TilS [Mangrovimonas sp. TPBH4]